MARTKTVQLTVQRDSGAFEMNANVATTVGYATMASGVLLAGAVGTAVAPGPVLGLVTLGGGVAVAGSYKDIRDYFKGDLPSQQVEPAQPVQAEAVVTPAA